MDSLMGRAEQHSRSLKGNRLHLYWLGYNAGRAAAKTGENTARILQTLIAEHPAQAAGYLEGIAAARAVA